MQHCAEMPGRDFLVGEAKSMLRSLSTCEWEHGQAKLMQAKEEAQAKVVANNAISLQRLLAREDK